MKKLALAAASALAMLASTAASAAVITASYNFTSVYASGPNPTITGSITLTYDPTTTDAITVDSFSSPVLASFTPVVARRNGGSAQQIVFGNSCGAASCGASTAGTFWNIINIDNQGNPTSSARTIYNPSGTFYQGTATTTRAAAAAVPEPATWGLMLAGFGLVGAGLRTRRRAVAFAA